MASSLATLRSTTLILFNKMKKNNKPLKKGWFNIEEMTVQFGGAMSKPEFIFTAKAIKCPTYKRMVKERESLGGGWYGSMEAVEKIYDRNYLVVKDGLCIGVMYDPYVISGIKSDLHPINEKTPTEIMFFFNSLKIPYQFYESNKVPLPNIIGKTPYDEWLDKDDSEPNPERSVATSDQSGNKKPETK